MNRNVVLALVAACNTPDFDGRYRVESYTLDSSSCDGPGEEIVPEYSTFEIRHRKLFGVRIHPVYSCDDDGTCAADNESDWSLVVIEDDLDLVAFEYAISNGNSCVLASVDQVIDDSVGGGVVLQNRNYELVLEPYDPRTCTTDNAKAMRDNMRCASVLELVGVPCEDVTIGCP